MSKNATTVEPTNEPAKYVMPIPHRGQAVVFYPNGIVTDQNSMVGYVTAISRTSVELNVNGMLKETVSHKNDPRVAHNQFVKRCGVWDFSPHDTMVNDRLVQLEAQVKALQELLESPTKK